MKLYLRLFLLITYLQGSSLFGTPANAQMPTSTATQAPLPTFQLRLSSSVLREGEEITATIEASRVLATDVRFRVPSLTFPGGNIFSIWAVEPIVLRAGTRSVSFPLQGRNDELYYGGRLVARLDAQVSSGPQGSVRPAFFTYLENDVPSLRLRPDGDTLREGNLDGGRIEVFVQSNFWAQSTVGAGTLSVTSSDPRSVVAVASEFAGNWGRFTLIGQNNRLNDGPRRVRITASARGLAAASFEITLLPLEAPFLRLKLQPIVARSGDTVQALLKREGDFNRTLTVRVEHSSQFKESITFLRVVTLAPGQSQVRFTLTVPTDNINNAPSPLFYEFQRITASALGYVPARVNIAVFESEPDLELLSDVAQLREGSTGRGQLILRLTKPYARPLTVRVRRFGSRLRFADAPTSASLRVTIPANTLQVRVPFFAQDNSVLDVQSDGFSPREGFASTLPFGFFSQGETELPVNVTDDEAGLRLELSTNLSQQLEDRSYLPVQGRLTLATPATRGLNFVVRMSNLGGSSQFEVLIPAGARTVSFELPEETRGFLARVTATQIDGSLGATAYISALNNRSIGARLVLAENGVGGALVLSRAVEQSDHAQVFRLRSRGNRLSLPSQVSFPIGAVRVTIPVRAIDDALRNDTGTEYVDGTPAEGGASVLLGEVVIVDDDTDIPTPNEQPSPQRLLFAHLISFENSARRARVRLVFSDSVQATSFASFDVQLNGRTINPQNLSVIPQSPDTCDLFLSDSTLAPGARIIITPTQVRDENALLLPTISFTLLVPSNPNA